MTPTDLTAKLRERLKFVNENFETQIGDNRSNAECANDHIAPLIEVLLECVDVLHAWHKDEEDGAALYAYTGEALAKLTALAEGEE